MKKKNKEVFEWSDDDYTILQLSCLKEIRERYPQYKWNQILSPFHSYLLYRHIVDELDNVEDGVRRAFSLYGNITMRLNWILHLKASVDFEMEYVYKELKEELGLDGDALADATVHRDDISYPFTVMNDYRNEREVEQYILRDAVSFEELEWVRDYVSNGDSEVNMVYAWNMNKAAYYKIRREETGE